MRLSNAETAFPEVQIRKFSTSSSFFNAEPSDFL